MKQFFCAIITGCVLSLAWAGAARAQGDALILTNSEYSVLDRLTGGGNVLSILPDLERQGFDAVSLDEARANQMRNRFGAFVRGLDAQTQRALVILSGRFVHTATDAFLLGIDSDVPGGAADVFGEALPLSQVLGVLAAYPGQAVLILGEGDVDALESPFLRAGAGRIDLPQGVTLIRGAPDQVARFVRRDLAVPETALVRAARDADLQVSGYAPASWVFLSASEQKADAAPAPVAAPDRSDADAQLWQSVVARDDLAGYRMYLNAFAQGAYANEARQRIRAIEAEPFRDARLAEETLDLSRDARRDIQRDLSLLDYNTRGIDGIFGPGTRGAVKSWQARNGFAESGFVDQEMIARLDGQAARRAAELEEEARQRQAEVERLDRAYWQETGSQGDLVGLRAYLDRYPDGVFAEIANERVDAIEQEQRDQAAMQDRRDWDAARDVGSAQAFQDYIGQNPQGAFVDQARSRIGEMRQPSGEREAVARAEAQEAALNMGSGARRIAESRLESLGLKPGRVDGEFDKNTRRAIRRYQDARNLGVTGYLDQATVVRLLADSLLR